MTTIRIVLFAILLLGMIGSGAELILLDHTEDWRQWIPLILIGLGLLASGWHGLQSTARSVRSLAGDLHRLHCERLSGNLFSLSGQRRIQIGIQPFAPRLALILGGG